MIIAFWLLLHALYAGLISPLLFVKPTASWPGSIVIVITVFAGAHMWKAAAYLFRALYCVETDRVQPAEAKPAVVLV